MSVQELDESVVHEHQSEQAKKTPENIQEPDDLELEKPVVMDDQSVQVSETSKDMQESDDNVVIEQPEEGTVTEVREELIEVTEDGMDLIKEDIRLVEIDGMTPTPNYLPSRITPTNLKYGNICDYRHFGLPEGKEDHRQVLLCPPSTYHYTKETGKEEPHEYYHFSRWLFWSCQNREV